MGTTGILLENWRLTFLSILVNSWNTSAVTWNIIWVIIHLTGYPIFPFIHSYRTGSTEEMRGLNLPVALMLLVSLRICLKCVNKYNYNAGFQLTWQKQISVTFKNFSALLIPENDDSLQYHLCSANSYTTAKINCICKSQMLKCFQFLKFT